MKQWALWQNQLVKWALFYIESYLAFMLVNLIFTIGFNESFHFPVIIIWFIFIAMSLFTTFLREVFDFGVYLLLGIFFIIGVFVYHFPFVIWGALLLYLLWRFNDVQEKDITYEEYFKMILIYILSTVFYFVINIMYQQTPPINIVLSYLIIFLFLLLGGIFMQLKGSIFSKKLLISTIIQISLIFFLITFLVILFPFIKPVIIAVMTFLKKIFYSLWLIGATFIYNLLVSRMKSNEQQGEDLLEKLKGNNEDNTKQAVEDIPEYYNAEVLHYVGIALSVIAIITIIVGIIYLVKRSEKNKLLAKQMNETYTNIDNMVQQRKKNKRDLFNFSANYYRKLYQQYLIWLMKRKMLEIDKVNTSVEIKENLVNKYPDIEQDIETLTTHYQQIRYGYKEPAISKKEFKELISRLKKSLKSI